MNYKYEIDALTETTEHYRQRSIPRNRNSVISKKQHVLSIFIIATNFKIIKNINYCFAIYQD